MQIKRTQLADADLIVYIVEVDFILIVGVLHHRMDVKSHLQ